MFQYIKRIYYQFTKLYKIKSKLDYIHNELPLHKSIEDLYPEFENLKQMIFNCGSLYIKFLQWYISKLKSNVYNDNTLEMQNTSKFIAYFEDIFEKCPFHSLEYTYEIFKNTMIDTTLEKYIHIETLTEIASGSIGQVYYAKRKSDNLEIAIKVKHPDIADDLENQLDIIKLIKFLQSFQYIRKRYNLVFNIDDFLIDIIHQCDFRIEAQNNIRFRENFKHSQKHIIFPEILFYSEDILISEYIPGESVTSLTEVQQFYTTLNFVCFFYQMLLIDNFIHGDLHCKNWKVRILNNKPQLIIYDCGICFSNINLNISNNFWFGLSTYNLDLLQQTIKHYITINNTNITNNEINNEINTLFNNITKHSISTTLFLKSIISFFISKNIIVHKFLLNFTILICVIEEFLKKNNIINRDHNSNNIVNMFDLLTENQLDIITFCNVNKCYPKVEQLFQNELNNKFIQYQTNILANNIDEHTKNTPIQPELFKGIVLSGLTFKSPETACSCREQAVNRLSSEHAQSLPESVSACRHT